MIVLVAFSMSTDCSSLFTSQRKFTDFFFLHHISMHLFFWLFALRLGKVCEPKTFNSCSFQDEQSKGSKIVPFASDLIHFYNILNFFNKSYLYEFCVSRTKYEILHIWKMDTIFFLFWHVFCLNFFVTRDSCSIPENFL